MVVTGSFLGVGEATQDRVLLIIVVGLDLRKVVAEDREVVLYCDLHGHSRKQNVFVYGCNNAGNPTRVQMERVFPRMLELNRCLIPLSSLHSIHMG